MYSSYSSYPSSYYSTYPTTTSAASDGVIAGILATLGGFVFVIIALALLQVVAQCFVFKKANRKWWDALIPIHSLAVEFEMAGMPTWWYFVMMIPVANIVVLFLKSINLAKAFGKGAGFGVGLALLPVIFYPILAWSKAEYTEPTTGV